VLDRWQTRQRDTRVPCLASFSHIFGGDYEAGYYAYQWAEMLSADAFAALREEGGSFLEQKAAALRFRKHVLAAGGLADMAENFRAFRGREPDLKHLLFDYGIA
jgi:oligopeptidase A